MVSFLNLLSLKIITYKTGNVISGHYCIIYISCYLQLLSQWWFIYLRSEDREHLLLRTPWNFNFSAYHKSKLTTLLIRIKKETTLCLNFTCTQHSNRRTDRDSTFSNCIILLNEISSTKGEVQGWVSRFIKVINKTGWLDGRFVFFVKFVEAILS